MGSDLSGPEEEARNRAGGRFPLSPTRGPDDRGTRSAELQAAQVKDGGVKDMGGGVSCYPHERSELGMAPPTHHYGNKLAGRACSDTRCDTR